ncbi:MAG TPA: carboxypeptidase-like regulatory domain-containing protein [Thermoanaerobaculia bacterium]
MRKFLLAAARFNLLALVLAASLPLAAQDTRGSISGTVSDDSGGALPGVTVIVKNSETNLANTATTDSKGFYQVRLLRPGTYEVKAALSGFATVKRTEVVVNVGDSLRIDLKLKVGNVESSIIVTGGAPLVDQTSPVTGQVVNREQIKELPLADGTAYMLSRMAPGVVEVSDLHFARPADNANLGQIIANGVKGGNDFTLDGAPNIVAPTNLFGGRIGFSPPADAIAEFKVETNSFDAQQGHTAGAVINLALRSGTNTLQGSASFFNRSSNRTANSPYAVRAGQDVVEREYDRGTVTLSGPIVPDQTFFLATYEKLKDLTGEPATYTVPSEKMRRGDFSDLLALGIKIYDPLTGTTNRTAFPGNVIPTNRLNSIAMNLLSYYPLPNQPGNADGTNNYFSNQPRTYNYDAFLLKLDQKIADGHQLFLNGYYNYRTEDRYNWAGVQNGFAVTQGLDTRDNFGATLGYTGVFSPEVVGDVRASYSKFGERRHPSDQLDPAVLGFNAQTVALFRGYQYIPRFDVAGFTTLGAQRSDYEQGFNRPFYNYGVAPIGTWMKGDHTVRLGYDLRYQKYLLTDDGMLAGRYNFTGAYTRASNSAAIQQGQALAQLLLGLPTSGGNSYIDVNTSGDFAQTSHALFIHDEWRVDKRLTVNAGFRLEVERGLIESYSRNIDGFDLTSTNPINDQASAAYAKNPIPEIPATEFRVRGGLTFSDGNIYDTQVKPLPRLGISYLIDPKTVARAGIGLFSFPYFFDAMNQSGFSQATLLVSTDNNGATFLTDLNNPFPNGLGVPPGSSLGLGTFLGRDLVTTGSSIIQTDRKTPTYTRWQAGLQRDLGKGWHAEVAYIGSQGRNLPVRHDLNGLPSQYVSNQAERDTAQEAYLAQAVTNPYAGLLPGTSFNGKTIQRGQLLRGYSQFGRLAVEEYNGSDSYHSLQVTGGKQFREGSSIVATFTWSKLMDQVNYLNPGDATLEKRISPDDRPYRATLAGIWKLPFGKGRAIGTNWNGILDAIFGGWQATAAFQWQKGQPILWYTGTNNSAPVWNNIYFNPACDPKSLSTDYSNKDGKIGGFDRPAWDISCFYPDGASGKTTDPRIAVGEANRRTFPTTLDNMRYPDLYLLDMGLSKTFVITGHVELQVRIEALNALNYTVFFTPDVNPRNATFGTFTTQRNNPRDFQLGARLSF